MATSSTYTVPHPYTEVFRTLVGVLPNHGFEIVATDEASGVIQAKTGINLRTWGETVTMRLGSPDGGSTTSMVIDSKLKFGIAAWGKHEKNFAAVMAALEAAFGGPAGGPPPPASTLPPPTPHPEPPPGA
jgi:hypothetical protein